MVSLVQTAVSVQLLLLALLALLAKIALRHIHLFDEVGKIYQVVILRYCNNVY